MAGVDQLCRFIWHSLGRYPAYPPT